MESDKISQFQLFCLFSFYLEILCIIYLLCDIGGGGGGYGGGDYIVQEDTVFVSGMNPATSEGDIQQHFGAIGVIKVSLKKKKLYFCS